MPVQPAIMILGDAATLLQMAANGLSAVPFIGLVMGAQALAWGALVCLQYTILVVQATPAVPSDSFDVRRYAPSLPNRRMARRHRHRVCLRFTALLSNVCSSSPSLLDEIIIYSLMVRSRVCQKWRSPPPFAAPPTLKNLTPRPGTLKIKREFATFYDFSAWRTRLRTLPLT